MRNELSIVEFGRRCEENREMRFCYNSGNNGGMECSRISLIFPPPSVTPNIGVVSFHDDSGNRLTLFGVKKIRVIQNTATGSKDYLFECQKGSATDRAYFCTI